MSAYKLPSKNVILKIHKTQLASHGGLPGIRDESGIDAAISRPQNLIDYGQGDIDVFDIATAIAFSIIKNRHPFSDGNKRIGAAVLHMTLFVNGYDLDISNQALVDLILSIADGSRTERELSGYCRAHSYKI